MNVRVRSIIAILGLVIAVLILSFGMAIPNIMQWRLHLLTGLWLLSLPVRVLIAQRVLPAARGLAQLTLMIVLSFVAVGLQLAREQIGQAVFTRERVAQLRQPVAQAPDLATSIRPGDRTALGNGQIWPVAVGANVRGTIRDRNGVVLAETRAGRRMYPLPDFGHIVGFQSRLYGNTGVEATYDLDLSGTRTFSTTRLLEARLLGTAFTTQPADIQLTLDTTLQQVAQEALGNRPGAVVLLDPRTGAILALATYPRFDPNLLVLPEIASDADVAQAQASWQALTQQADSPLLNRATQGRYPPGSVIKTFTAAAALDSGLLPNPEAQVTCPNRLNTEAGAPPVINSVENLAQRTGDPSDLRRVYAWSCNTAFAQIGLGLGAERFTSYANTFGLGFAAAPREPALRDIAAEAGTIANNTAFLQQPVALADTAFGQGQALVTPLDMAQMVALVANNGVMMRPYLVQEVKSGDQVRFTAQPEIMNQVIRLESAIQLRDIMRSSVEFGYAKPVALSGVTIGAKTGTAEAPGGAPHAWFVAIAPVEQPRFAIAVIVERGGEGSRNALPIARTVLAAALGVQP